jgi:hypothetical protein
MTEEIGNHVNATPRYQEGHRIGRWLVLLTPSNKCPNPKSPTGYQKYSLCRDEF